MRYTQPQSGPLAIDRGHPLARGLVSYMPLVGKSYSDAVDSKAWAVSGTSPVAYDGAPRGLGLRVKGATPAYVTRPIPAAITSSPNQPVTMRFRLYFHTAPTSHAIMSWGSSPQDGAPRFYVHISGPILQFFFSTYHWNPTVVAEREYIVTHTFDGATMNTYMDGVLVGSASGVSWAGNAASLYLGMGYDGQQAASDFLLSDFAMWNRALSPQEVASDAQNPWQMAKSAQRVMLGTAGGAIPTTLNLTPASAALSLTGYAPAIGQTVTLNLSPAAKALTLTGPAPTITQTSTRNLALSQTALTLAGFAPSISQSASQNITPSARAITLAGLAPTIGQTVSANLGPASAALVLTGLAPSVTRTANLNLLPAPAALVFSGYAPSIFQGPTGSTPEYGLSTVMRASVTNCSVSGLLASYGIQAGTLRDTYALSTILRATSTNRTAALDAAPINLTVRFP